MPVMASDQKNTGPPVALSCDRLDLLVTAGQQLSELDNSQTEDGRSSPTDVDYNGMEVSSCPSASSLSSSSAVRARLNTTLREDHLEYGPEVFDMLKVMFGRSLGYHQPWPNWLRYNPVFWLMYAVAMLFMVVGDRFHRCVGQKGAVPQESVAERRLRVHWIYQFDAYLLLCFLYYLLDVVIALATGNRQPRHTSSSSSSSPSQGSTTHHMGHEDYEDEVAFGAGLMVICAVWVACNVWGLSAMFRKNALMMKVYVTANIGWSVLLVLLLLAECVGYAHFRTAILFHALTVAFFLLFDYLYFLGLWDLYPLRVKPYWVPLCVLATLAFLLLAMFSCVQSARPELWYLLSGTI